MGAVVEDSVEIPPPELGRMEIGALTANLVEIVEHLNGPDESKANMN